MYRRLLLLPALATLALTAGCATDSSLSEDGVNALASAGTACTLFAEVFVDANEGGQRFTTSEAQKQIADASQLAQYAAELEARFANLAEGLQEMSDAMGRDDVRLAHSLGRVNDGCESVFDELGR